MGFFKVRKVTIRKRQCVAVARSGRIGESRIISARQLLRMFDGKVSHQWHAIVLEMTEP